MNEPALRALLDAVDAGAPAALITVAATRGSTPTEVGARLLVHASGKTVGTIGGGRLEAKAIGVALEMLTSPPRPSRGPRALDQPSSTSNPDSHDLSASRPAPHTAAPFDEHISRSNADSQSDSSVSEASASRPPADPPAPTTEPNALPVEPPRREPPAPDSPSDADAPDRRRRPPSRVIASLHTWNLQRDVGMTCGGEVTILVEAHLTRPWRVVIFGAGHVAQALAPLLLTLDVSLRVIDPRPDWLTRLPPAANPTRADDPDEAVAAAPSDAAVVLMTQGHRTDLPLLERLLRRGTHPFIGVIGSRAKAAVLRQELSAAGLPDARFTCPVGLDLGRDEPAEIAISIAAQLLQVRDAAR